MVARLLLFVLAAAYLILLPLAALWLSLFARARWSTDRVRSLIAYTATAALLAAWLVTFAGLWVATF